MLGSRDPNLSRSIQALSDGGHNPACWVMVPQTRRPKNLLSKD